MADNRRPETMERITTPQLAQAFIDEQLVELRAAGTSLQESQSWVRCHRLHLEGTKEALAAFELGVLSSDLHL